MYNRYENASSNYTIKSGSGNDVVNNNGNHALISTGAGNDTIRNSYNRNFTPSNTISAYNTIDADKGNDTIILSDSYYDSVAGDKALIKYASGDGNDLIQGFGENSTLSITGGSYSTQVSGLDMIVTVGDGTITLNGAANLSTVNINNNLRVTDSATSPVTVGSAVKTIDASARTAAVKITGNSKANTIIGGSKGDSLVGGKGNDSLWGNAGADKFIYSSGDGNDVIYGFDNKDTLTFDNIEFTTSYSKKNKAVTFTTSGGSVTLKDFSATTFHINNDTYKISGTKLISKQN